MELKDRVAFISGGSGGLGSSIAKSPTAACTDICDGFNKNKKSARESVRAVRENR